MKSKKYKTKKYNVIISLLTISILVGIFAIKSCSEEQSDVYSEERSQIISNKGQQGSSELRKDKNSIASSEITLSKHPSKKELTQAIEMLFGQIEKIKTTGYDFIEFNIVWDKRQQKMSLEEINIIKDDKDNLLTLLWDKVTDETADQLIETYNIETLRHAVRNSRYLYIIHCSGGSKGSWEKQTTSGMKAAKITQGCFDKGGCATICRKEPEHKKLKTVVTYLPSTFLKAVFKEREEWYKLLDD